MAFTTLRFLHSGDWRLDRPLSGLSEVPDQLRELFVEASYLAAERVVETALAEKVDFVLLTGGLLDARRTGPVGPAFLLKQCERLQERGIAVYWLPDRADQRWPATLLLPGNVHRFDTASYSHFTHQRDGEAVAHLAADPSSAAPTTALAQFADQAEHFTIALTHGAAGVDTLRSIGIRYWACGGRHKRHTLFSGRTTAHDAGTPQGRSARESGPHGCTLVEIDADSKIHSRFVPTDVVRWRTEQIELEAHHTPGDLERIAHERLAERSARDEDLDLVIHWVVQLRTGLPSATWRHRASELLESLRAKYGYATPLRWSAAMSVQSASGEIPAELRGEDSILGDFLSEVARYQLDPSECLDLTSFVSERQAVGLSGALGLNDAKLRERVLEQVAALGYDLLGSGDRAEETR